jgi:hypothetical protein
MSPRRSLPLYGGTDAPPRPEVRDQVMRSLLAGADPVALAERVADNLDALALHVLSQDVPGEARPACARGCSYCCHGRVEVTAPEVFLLARLLRARRDPVRDARIAATAARLAPLDGRGHHAAQVPCSLLDAHGACTVYAARPLACRRAFSTDAAVCAAASADPSLDVPIPAPYTLQWNLSALVLGWMEGCAHGGRPPHHHELNGALHLALSQDDAEARWHAGEDPLRPSRTRSAEELPELLGRPA